MKKLFENIIVIGVIAIFGSPLGIHSVQAGQMISTPDNTLPFNLDMQDTMATVEQKFGQPVHVGVPQAGWVVGLPDEGGSPDHIHYWAVYKRFGVTVVYNSPSANDKNATISTILVNK